MELGLLTPAEVAAVLELKRARDSSRVRFAELARRAGYLTAFESLAVIGAQRRRQHPIGQYFVSRGLLDTAEVEELVRAVGRHNWAHRHPVS